MSTTCSCHKKVVEIEIEIAVLRIWIRIQSDLHHFARSE